MQGLLVVAHGSRRQASNQEVVALAAALAKQSRKYQWVEAAFLELSEPSIQQGIAAADKAGVGSLLIYPHFLAAGTHVVNDLPRIVAQAQDEHPRLHLRLGGHLGGIEGLVRFLDQAL